VATENTEQSRQERFLTWNPYAGSIIARLEEEADLLSNDQLVGLAIAFEISQLRTEIHFAAKGRRS
jgi:hypothetical protein